MNIANGVAASLAQANGAPEKMKLKLQAKDGTIVEVDSDVAFKSNLIAVMARNLGLVPNDARLAEPLPISSVDGNILKKILVYCVKSRGEQFVPKPETADPRIELTQWDIEYLAVNNEVLTDMLMGANFMDIPGLIEIITQKIANMAEGKTVEELRILFGLENDFTPDEELEIKQRFEWVEQ